VLEVGVDLGGEVLAGGLVGPGGGVAQVELDGVLLEGGPVLEAGVHGCAQLVEGACVVRLQLAFVASLFLGADEGGLLAVGEQVVADVAPEEVEIVLAGDLVPTTATGMPNSAAWSRYWR
jgi:hypothetical protein